MSSLTLFRPKPGEANWEFVASAMRTFALLLVVAGLVWGQVITTGGWNVSGLREPLVLNVETAWLPPLMRPYAAAAVERWQQGMGAGNLRLDVDEPRTIRFIYRPLGRYTGFSTFPWWSGWVSLVTINSDIYGEAPPFSNKFNIMRTLVHEFGHALGLIHVDDPASIMYPQHDPAQTRPTLRDIVALGTLYRVRPSPFSGDTKQKENNNDNENDS